MQGFLSNILFFLPALLGQWLHHVSFFRRMSPSPSNSISHFTVGSQREMSDGRGSKSRVWLASCSLRRQTGRKGSIADIEISIASPPISGLISMSSRLCKNLAACFYEFIAWLTFRP
jgi:hypothetical protein